VRNVVLTPSTKRAFASCAAGERLVDATHSVGFFTRRPPTAGVVSAVRATRSTGGRRVTVALHAGALHGVRASVQVAAVCAGGA
jgi:hypothetical protein